jgi:hypothetical protein
MWEEEAWEKKISSCGWRANKGGKKEVFSPQID